MSEHGNPPRHPATDTCDDTCPTWLHSRATCCHFHTPTDPEATPVTSVPPTQPPAAPETDAGAWVAELTEAHRDSYPMGNINHGTPDNPNWGTFCVECKESWPCDVSRLLERVRVVEADRDAAMAEERERIAQAIEERAAVAERQRRTATTTVAHDASDEHAWAFHRAARIARGAR